MVPEKLQRAQLFDQVCFQNAAKSAEGSPVQKRRVGLGLVWGWFGVGLGLVWGWFGVVRGWFGVGLGLVWGWFGVGLGWFGVGLGLV